MSHLIDLLVWIFPALNDSMEDWRRSDSPVHLILIVLLCGLGVFAVMLAIVELVGD